MTREEKVEEFNKQKASNFMNKAEGKRFLRKQLRKKLKREKK